MPEKPTVSIIIPNYNGTKLFKENLPSVIKHSPGAEIIVVDDCSTDDSVQFLKTNFPEVKVVVHETNKRFAAACNSGVAAAQGEIILLINSDVIPQEGYLDPLLKAFSDPQVFAVGCKEMDDRVTPPIIQGRAGGAFRRGLMIHWRCNSQDQDTTLWVSGGSGAFRKSVWNELGGMDTAFRPAYEEDRDICYRALKRGYLLKFAPDSLVLHHHETTNKTALGLRNMQLASFKNQLLLIWKNVTDSKYILLHLLWLPYHLTFTAARSHGLFLKAFFQAVKQLPEIWPKRQLELKARKLSDAFVLSQSPK